MVQKRAVNVMINMRGQLNLNVFSAVAIAKLQLPVGRKRPSTGQGAEWRVRYGRPSEGPSPNTLVEMFACAKLHGLRARARIFLRTAKC